jgi:hypothetical protein
VRASTIVALSTFSLALCATAAHAEEKAKPAARGNEITLEVVKIKARVPRPQVAIDISRLVQKAPLPELKKPLADRIAAAVEKDPF